MVLGIDVKNGNVDTPFAQNAKDHWINPISSTRSRTLMTWSSGAEMWKFILPWTVWSRKQNSWDSTLGAKKVGFDCKQAIHTLTIHALNQDLQFFTSTWKMGLCLEEGILFWPRTGGARTLRRAVIRPWKARDALVMMGALTMLWRTFVGYREWYSKSVRP